MNDREKSSEKPYNRLEELQNQMDEEERRDIEKLKPYFEELEKKHQKNEEKLWGDVSKTCPECGNELVLKQWATMSTKSFPWMIGGPILPKAVIYSIYYAHCDSCRWQKRTFEEWIEVTE